MEGWRETKGFAMGDGMLLLHSEKEGVIERAREEKKKWWSNHFLNIKKLLPHLTGKQRRTWLKLYGVPLHIWEESVFKKIGGRIGEFLDFDVDTAERKRFDVARILISTYRWGFIDDWVRVDVMGASYNIWVVEETTGNAEKGLEELEFSEEKNLPENHGGSRWQEENGGSDQFSDEDTVAGSDDQEVEEEVEEGT